MQALKVEARVRFDFMGVFIRLLRILALVCLVLFVFLLGAYSNRYNTFFWDFLKGDEPEFQLYTGTALVPKIDAYGRNVFKQEKQEIICPKQNKNVGVILVVGQSNSANHASIKYQTRYPEQVLNYFSGKCYIAASPLLGATGENGEFATMLADSLVGRGTYQSVILVASGVGGSKVSQWEKSGPLGEMLYTTLLGVRSYFRITDVVWHQGESDFDAGTLRSRYVKSFKSLLSRIAEAGVDAPVFISVSTVCGKKESWYKDNPVSLAQRSLIDGRKIFLGADTDALLSWEDRNPADYCHLGESGQRKTAAAYSDAINFYHARHH